MRAVNPRSQSGGSRSQRLNKMLGLHTGKGRALIEREVSICIASLDGALCRHPYSSTVTMHNKLIKGAAHIMAL